MNGYRNHSRLALAAPVRARRISLSLVSLALVLGAGACKKGAKGADSAAASSAVTVGAENVAVAETQQVSVGPTISGTLEPEESATIRAEVSGSVLGTYADAGQQVRAGQLLARLDDSAIESQVVSARSAVATAENSYAIAEREVQRTQTLVNAGALAERNLEQARNAASSAATQLANARSALANATKMEEKTRITSPMGGIVSQRQVNAGDVVQPGAALFTIVNPASMRLVASVPSDQLSSIRVGIPVEFTVNGYPNRHFTGRVTRVNPTVDPATRQVQITVSIPNVGSTLVGGLYAQGKAATESRTATVVPIKALDERTVRPTVTRVKNGVVQRVEVTVGLRDEDLGIAAIQSGLAPGDTVLLGAAQGISPGTPVTIGAAPSDVAGTPAAQSGPPAAGTNAAASGTASGPANGVTTGTTNGGTKRGTGAAASTGAAARP